MNKYKLLAILNSLGLVGTLVVNYLATSLPINGKDTGELSDAYPNLFVPSGFTFSIWGIIYLFLIAFIVYQFIGIDLKNSKSVNFLSRISFFFIFTCILNMLWIYMWHYQMLIASVLIMTCFLLCLIYIYVSLEVGKRKVSSTEKWFVHVPFSIYLGWITVALIANITALLVHLDWNGFGITEIIWTVIMISIASFIGIMVHNDRRDNAYLLVLIWAFYGIFSKRSDIGGLADTVALAAAFGGVLLLITLVMGLFKKNELITEGS